MRKVKRESGGEERRVTCVQPIVGPLAMIKISFGLKEKKKKRKNE